MDGRFEKLLDERTKLEEDLKKLLIQRLREMLDDFSKGKITEKDLLDNISEYTYGTKDQFFMIKLLVKLADDRMLKIPRIKKNLAHRYYERAKNKFLRIENNYLKKASELFKETGDSEMSEKVKKLHSKMYNIHDENWDKLKKFS